MQKSQKIISIVGPTATGKTAFALRLAESVLQSEVHENVWKKIYIISVDSRQVYKGVEICSGSDVPKEWQLVENGFKHPILPIFLLGTSMILPHEEWSVAHFRRFVIPLIEKAAAQNALVILVGGTGLYHQQLFASDPLLDVPPNSEVRDKAALLSLENVQKWVENEAPHYWQVMNYSDRQNPRRLVRALEKELINQSKKINNGIGSNFNRLLNNKIDLSIIGITDDIKQISVKIRQRVLKRLQLGAIDEVQTLLARYDFAQDLAAFSATGCREIRLYIEDQLSYEEMIELWTKREVQYAKRQLTWWKGHQSVVEGEHFHTQRVKWYNLADFRLKAEMQEDVTVAPTVTLDNEEQNNWQTAAIASCILEL